MLRISVPTTQASSSATTTLLGSKPFRHPLLFNHKFRPIALTAYKATIIAYGVIRPFVRSGTLTYVRATINNATDPLTWAERHHISKQLPNICISAHSMMLLKFLRPQGRNMQMQA